MDYPTRSSGVMNASNHGRGYLGHRNWTPPTAPADDRTCSSYNKHGGSYFGYGCVHSALGSLYYTTLRLRAADTAVLIHNSRYLRAVQQLPAVSVSRTHSTAGQEPGLHQLSFKHGWQGANIPKHNMYVLPMLAENRFARTVTRTH